MHCRGKVPDKKRRKKNNPENIENNILSGIFS